MRTSRADRGTATVEFALVSIPFFVLVMGAMQYGFYFWTAETTNSAAREAARRVVVGDCWDKDDLKAFATAHAARALTADYSPVLEGSSTLAAGDAVTVTVTADGTVLGLLPLPNDGKIIREYVAHLETTTQSETEDDSCAP